MNFVPLGRRTVGGISTGTEFVLRDDASGADIPGIVIADGGVGSRVNLRGSRVRAFVYGEGLPPAPEQVFGRWRAAS